MLDKRKLAVWHLCVLTAIALIVAIARGCGSRSGHNENSTSTATESAGDDRGTTFGNCAVIERVIDGDTIDVIIPGDRLRVRLHGIDAPERGQDFWLESKQFVQEEVSAECLQVEVIGTDRYGRSIAWVWLESGKSLNESIVRHGYAWWYQKYASTDATLEHAEKYARQNGRGIWSQPSAIPPWEVRP